MRDAIRAGVVFAGWLAGPLLAAGAGGPLDARPFLDARLPDCGIQKAMDSLGDKGGVVLLPEGRFRMRRYVYLRSSVTLRGRGAKTVLTVAEPEQRRLLAEPAEAKSQRITVRGDLAGLTAGTIVHVWRSGPRTHRTHMRALDVQAVEGRTIVFRQPYPYPLRLAAGPFVSWGRTTRLAADSPKGARSLRVEHPGVFRAGYALFLKGTGDLWNHHFNVATAIEGEMLRLDRPLTVEAKRGAIVHQAHCMITADGEKDIGVEDLAVEGWAGDRPASWRGFMLSAIHTVRCRNIRIRNVHVRCWNDDGISIQAAKDVVVTGCSAERCKGHGFHPGTGFDNGEFTYLRSVGNGGDGLYYCWHNRHVNVRNCLLKDNDGHGIGGLGNPGDRHNTIEGNTIEGNGRAGIAVNGGKVAHNVIRGNVIRDNSRSRAGKYPGILLEAAVEDARACTIEDNTIESTLAEPTQWVGVHERCGRYRDKPTLADENIIRGNRFHGHKTADVIVVGARTVVDNAGAKVVRTRPTTRPK